MRFLLFASFLVLLAFVIKIDLNEGTLPLASFYSTQLPCTQPSEIEISYITVQIVEGDTIYSLFSSTPSPIAVTFPERLAQFYTLNPHLQLQTLVTGDIVRIPIVSEMNENCTK